MLSPNGKLCELRDLCEFQSGIAPWPCPISICSVSNANDISTNNNFEKL